MAIVLSSSTFTFIFSPKFRARIGHCKATCRLLTNLGDERGTPPRDLPHCELSPHPLNIGEHSSLSLHNRAVDDDRLYSVDTWPTRCFPDYTFQTSTLRATRHNSPASESPTSSRSSSARQLFHTRSHFVCCTFRYRTTQTKIS